jgi:hypothetical protein
MPQIPPISSVAGFPRRLSTQFLYQFIFTNFEYCYSLVSLLIVVDIG